jgi:hypothetical protein
VSKQLARPARVWPASRRGVVGFLAALMVATVTVVAPLPMTTANADTGGIDPTADMATVSWGPNRIDLFAKGTDGSLKHKFYNGRWSTWESLGGGAITSGPAAASWGAGRLDVFARSTANSLLHRWYANGAWSGWEDLGGSLYSAPAAVSWGAGRIDVFVRGANNVLYQKAYHAGWGGWSSRGTGVISAPTVASWDVGRLDVFYRGGGNAMYHIWYSNSAWSGVQNMGGVFTSSPAAVSWGTGRIDIFGRGTNNQVYHRYFSGGWSPSWGSLGGSMATSPAVASWGSGRLDVFARGTDQTLQTRSWTGAAWSAWRIEPDTAPTVPTGQNSPVVAVQPPPSVGALVGALEYAYVNNIGQLVIVHQRDPSIFSELQYIVVSGLERFSGPPTLGVQPDGKVQVSALHESSDVWAKTQTAVGSATWNSGWLDQGGRLASPLAVGRQGDGSLVLFAVDAAGALWSITQSTLTSSFGTWRSLGDVNLVGVPTVVTTRDGLQVFGVDTTGAVRTVSLSSAGVVSAWTNVGGSGFTGTPAAVVLPGYQIRLFVRSADGTIVTKMQDDTGAWPTAWDPVGTLVTAGSPTALLSPTSGKTEVVVRTADGALWSTGETLQGSGQWRDWLLALDPTVYPAAATDPTAFPFNPGTGPTWAVVYRDINQLINVVLTSAQPASAGATANTEPPRFSRPHTLPPPPKK